MSARRSLAVLAFVLGLAPFACPAWDGDRQGFVLGGGLGLSPGSRWSAWGRSETALGLGMNLFGGYAWNERDMVGYEQNVTFYHSDYFNSDSFLDAGSPLTLQGFQGASWYHYYPTRAGGSFFTVAGLGFCEFDRGPGYHSDRGAAWLLGGGHTLSRHLQAGIYFAAGRTTDAGHDFSHRHLGLLVSGFAF